MWRLFNKSLFTIQSAHPMLRWQFRNLLLEINILLFKKLLHSTLLTLIDNFAHGADDGGIIITRGFIGK